MYAARGWFSTWKSSLFWGLSQDAFSKRNCTHFCYSVVFSGVYVGVISWSAFDVLWTHAPCLCFSVKSSWSGNYFFETACNQVVEKPLWEKTQRRLIHIQATSNDRVLYLYRTWSRLSPALEDPFPYPTPQNCLVTSPRALPLVALPDPSYNSNNHPTCILAFTPLLDPEPCMVGLHFTCICLLKRMSVRSRVHARKASEVAVCKGTCERFRRANVSFVECLLEWGEFEWSRVSSASCLGSLSTRTENEKSHSFPSIVSTSALQVSLNCPGPNCPLWEEQRQIFWQLSGHLEQCCSWQRGPRTCLLDR